MAIFAFYVKLSKLIKCEINNVNCQIILIFVTLNLMQYLNEISCNNWVLIQN